MKTSIINGSEVSRLSVAIQTNEDYDEESLRADMFNVGLLMRCLGNFQVAIRTAEENAGAVVRSEKEGAAE
jgi:predicted transport protein